MSKSKRIEKRTERIEKRFRRKIAKGKKGTDMDIELHERRIKNLKDKSPLNFGFMTAAAKAIQKGGKSARIKKLENQMQTVMRDRNKNYDMGADMNDPEFATATESQPGSLEAPVQEDTLTPMNSFSPQTLGAANKMFGTEEPGSFDRDMCANPLSRHKSGHKVSKWRQMENEKFAAEKAAHKAEKARLLEITRKRREKTYGTDQSSWGK